MTFSLNDAFHLKEANAALQSVIIFMREETRHLRQIIYALLACLLAVAVLLFVVLMHTEDAWGQELVEVVSNGVLEGPAIAPPSFDLGLPADTTFFALDENSAGGDGVFVTGEGPLEPETLFRSFFVPVAVVPSAQEPRSSASLPPNCVFLAPGAPLGPKPTPSAQRAEK
jgi:hypothetical protein